MSGAVDWPTIGVMVGLGVFLWRALGARVDAFGPRLGGLLRVRAPPSAGRASTGRTPRWT